MEPSLAPVLLARFTGYVTAVYDHIFVRHVTCFSVIMVALWNRADHYIFALWFLLLLSSVFYLSFFPRLISAVADWMSAILPHMVWP